MIQPKWGATMATPWRWALWPCRRTRRRQALMEAMPWCLEKGMLYFCSCEPHSTSNKTEY
jgi:hypothetical protein